LILYIAWESIISRLYTLQEINQVLTDVEKGSVLKAVIEPNLS
jgi:Zn-dependent alcohol dehydrogenase